MLNNRPIIVDCDTGRDDALALWLAIKLGHNLAGVITSYGNTNVENVTDNTAGVLSFIGADSIPVLKGCAAPSYHHKAYRDVVIPRQQASGNGLCNIIIPTKRENYQSAISIEAYADFICDIAEKQGKIDYIILGPATNFANLCQYMGDEIISVISSVTMLGGKVGDLWQKNPVADFNVICDPAAVSVVLKTALKKKFITLDSTWDISISLDDVLNLLPMGSIGNKTKEIIEKFCREFAPEPIFRFHDPSVMLLYNHSNYLEWCVDINLDENHSEYGRLYRVESGGAMVGICDYKNLDRSFLLKIMLNALDLGHASATNS